MPLTKAVLCYKEIKNRFETKICLKKCGRCVMEVLRSRSRGGGRGHRLHQLPWAAARRRLDGVRPLLLPPHLLLQPPLRKQHFPNKVLLRWNQMHCWVKSWESTHQIKWFQEVWREARRGRSGDEGEIRYCWWVCKIVQFLKWISCTFFKFHDSFKAGEEITVHYSSGLKGRLYRQRNLWDGWYFHCRWVWTPLFSKI